MLVKLIIAFVWFIFVASIPRSFYSNAIASLFFIVPLLLFGSVIIFGLIGTLVIAFITVWIITSGESV